MEKVQEDQEQKRLQVIPEIPEKGDSLETQKTATQQLQIPICIQYLIDT